MKEVTTKRKWQYVLDNNSSIRVRVWTTIIILWSGVVYFCYLKFKPYFLIYYIHFEISGDPCNLTGSRWCDLFKNRTILLLMVKVFYQPMRKINYITITNCLFNKTNQIAEICKTSFATFYKPAHSSINKTFLQAKKSCIWATEFCDLKMDVIKL